MERPFFIVGFPRSGTTLLQAMLMRLEGICIPPETHFLLFTRSRRRLLGPLDSPEGFEATLRTIHTRVCLRNELPVDWPQLESEFRHARRTDAAMLEVLLKHMQSRMPTCRRIGEKTPGHLLWANYLFDSFPDCQIINLIRDGRDASVSHRESLDSSYGLLASAVRWRYAQRVHFRLREQYPADRYCSVRYEDLVTDPEPELRRLCDFLGEPFTAAMLEHHRREETGFASREKHKMRTLEPLTASRIGRYREAMSEPEIAMFQLVAGKELRALGYELDRISRAKGLLLALMHSPGVILRRLRWRRSVRREAAGYRSQAAAGKRAEQPEEIRDPKHR